MQKSSENWLEGKSETTKKMYSHYLAKFLDWTNLDESSVLKLDDHKIQDKLESYRAHLQSKLAVASVRPFFHALHCFFNEYDRTSINFKKIMKKITDPNRNKKSGGEAWTTEQIQSMLKIAKTPKVRALIHVLASTACRVGAISELKLKHVSDIENCKAVLFYPDTKDEYFGFLTPEASQSLIEYLTKRENDGEKLNKESPLFRQTYQFGKEKTKPLSKQSIQVHIAKTIKHLQRTKNGHRYNIQLDHGFRKRLNTIVKSNDSVNLTWAEKLLGHSVTIPLDESYVDDNKTKLKTRVFKEFKKHIANLTIDDAERQKAENDNLKAELSEKQKLEAKVAELESKMAKSESETVKKTSDIMKEFDKLPILDELKDRILREIKFEYVIRPKHENIKKK